MKDLTKYLEYNCANYPNRIAVIDGTRKISYNEFYKLYSNLSFQLQLVNDKPKVVLDLSQSTEAYALITAVLNLGGTFCPLNPDSPIERKLIIIDEFKPDIVVVDIESKLDLYNNLNVKTISSLLMNKPNKSVIANYNNDDTAYVIYTSGSTGQPKGVMIYRKALNKFLEWSISTYQATENDIWGQYSLLSFDLSIVDIFTCLCSGATLLVLADAPSKLIPSGAIERNKITIWHSVPSAVDFMIRREETRKADFSSLRILSFCGEPLRRYYLDFLFGKNSTVSIFNTYGPTEGTLFCSWEEFRIVNYNNSSGPTMSIGKAIPGWNLKLERLEDSDEKEIILYGNYIGQGYLNSNSPNNFEDILIDGKKFRSFKSGDLVIEKNGNLFFSRRKDRQIKIRGHRIELDEIDVWNRKYFNSFCITIEHNGGLYSFIETEMTIDEGAARVFLTKKLEEYKIPRAFIAIKVIPRNPNLKTNIKALIELI